jgi:hypothetical protein
LAAVLLMFAGQVQAQAPAKKPPVPDGTPIGSSDETERIATVANRGPILLIDRFNDQLTPVTTVIVRDEKDKSLARNLLEAVFPKEMGVPYDPPGPPAGTPVVLTVTEAVARDKHAYLKAGMKEDKAEEETRKLLSAFQSDLMDHFAIVRRDQHSHKAESTYQGISDP